MTSRPVSPVQKGLLAGLAIFALGFGAMFMFWLGSDFSGERGLTYYLSAMAGDALVLPLLAFLGTRVAVENETTHRERRLACVVGAVGVLGGAATQVLWLRNDRITLNWTFASVHNFNAAGWYHAVFLSLATGFFLGLTALVMVQYRRLGGVPKRRGYDYLFMAFLVVVFTSLLATDNNRSSAQLDLRNLIMPVAAAGALALAIRLIAGSHHARLAVYAALLFIVIAVETTVWLGTRQEYTALSLILSAACFIAGMGVVTSPHTRLIEHAYRATPQAMALALPILSMPVGTRDGILALGTSFLCGAAVLSFFLSFDNRFSWQVLSDSIVPIGLLMAVGTASLIGSGSASVKYSDWLPYLVSVVVLIFVTRAIRQSFQPVISAEEAARSVPYLQRERTAAYLHVATLGWLALTTVVISLTTTAPRVTGVASEVLQQNLILCLVAALSAPILLRLCRNQDARSSLQFLYAVGFSLLGLSALFASPPRSLIDCVQLWSTIAGTIFAGLFTAEGIRANVFALSLRPVFRRDRTNILTAGYLSASFSFALLASTSTVHSLRADWLLVLIFMLIFGIGTVAISVANTWNFERARRAEGFRINTPLGGVAQDQFVGVLMVVLGIGLPLVLAAGRSLTDGLASIIGYLALVAGVFVYLMQNNQRHVKSEFAKCKLVATSEDPGGSRSRAAYVDQLRIHCNRQNMISGIPFLTPMGLPYFFVLVGTLMGAHAKEDMRDLVGLFVVRDESHYPSGL